MAQQVMPVTTGAPDLVDRLEARRRAWAQRHPVAGRRLAAMLRAWRWASLVLLVVCVVMPTTRPGVAAWLAALYPLVQVLLVGRTRTVAVMSCLRWVSVGVVAFALIVGIQWLLLTATATPPGGAIASVWLAPASEEALKVVPLLLWAWAARRRVAAWGLVDWATVGMAVGTGAEVGESVARRLVSAHAEGIFASLLRYEEFYPGLAWLSWLPDQFDASPLGYTFDYPSHGVPTAAVPRPVDPLLHGHTPGNDRLIWPRMMA